MTKANIHIEKPDGEVVTQIPSGKSDDKPEAKDLKSEAAANAAGPKANPDERANANLTEEEIKKANDQTGPGTEITDGEGG